MAMDFSAMMNELAMMNERAPKAQESQDPNITPILRTRELNLNPEELMADIQQRKKENEMTHKAKARKNKQVEKSKGYFEKLNVKDKERKKAGKKDMKKDMKKGKGNKPGQKK
jgi:hypothetical protein